MTNLYETLGVTHDATEEEIIEAYKRLSQFLDPTGNAKEEDLEDTLADDPIMKIYFADITLAYKTLSNKTSRAEYDEYIS